MLDDLHPSDAENLTVFFLLGGRVTPPSELPRWTSGYVVACPCGYVAHPEHHRDLLRAVRRHLNHHEGDP